MRTFLYTLMLLFAAGGLAACNYDGSSSSGESASEKSTIYVSLTDADGDFLVYHVNVTSLSLTRRDGVEVDLLPQSSELDFAQYVELSELFTTAQIPLGVYTGGTITIDYSNADIQVEQNGMAVPAVIVAENGTPVTTLTLELTFNSNGHLVVRPGSPALLELDFDLEASHVINFGSTPATATITPVFYANTEIEDGKTQRLRGPLAAVALDESVYSIALRPFHRRDGDFGSVRIHTDADTSFEIDGVVYTGAEGLEVLAGKTSGTATIALAEFDLQTHQFLASVVYAGSSVPGGDMDAARGVVTARTADTLTLHGALLVRTDGSVSFSDVLTVNLGPDTYVTKPVGGEGNLGKDAVSVGQQVTVFGAANGLQLDASAGWVRMGFTRVNGTVVVLNGNELVLDVESINRRRISLFDFTGTGLTQSKDADPANYQVEVNGLNLTGIEGGEPVRVSGFAMDFGMAPADFTAWSVANFESAHAAMDITWDNSTAAFLSIGANGIVLNLDDPLLGNRHHLRRGGIVTNLLGLSTAPTITSTGTDSGIYVIHTADAVTIYTDFASFIDALTQAMDGTVGVARVHAIGGYDATGNTLAARRLAVILK